MKEDKTLASFEFLQRMAESQATFTLGDLSVGSGWTEENTFTNISKKLANVILPIGDKYKADRRILSVPYDRYASLFKQKRNLFVEYRETKNPDVTLYEFFLPLTLEHELRRALDDLFFKDTVTDRLKAIGLEHVSGIFPKQSTESERAFFDRVAEFVGEKFVGYSIEHVDGRFRAGGLLTRDEAKEQQESGRSYVIDETTAIVRFIVPHSVGQVAESASQLPLPLGGVSIDDQIARTDWAFTSLFVGAVLEATTDQDEIWVLKSGQASHLSRFVADDREE